jgi:hypothetical protein
MFKSFLYISNNFVCAYFSQKDIPVSNYRTHTLHCAKNVLKCRECDVVVPGGNIKAHNQEAHTLQLCDMCQIKVEAYKMPEHKV